MCFLYYSDFNNFQDILNLWTLLYLSISLYINWEVTISTKVWIVNSAETERQNLPFRTSKQILREVFFQQNSRIPFRQTSNSIQGMLWQRRIYKTKITVLSRSCSFLGIALEDTLAKLQVLHVRCRNSFANFYKFFTSHKVKDKRLLFNW